MLIIAIIVIITIITINVTIIILIYSLAALRKPGTDKCVTNGIAFKALGLMFVAR